MGARYIMRNFTSKELKALFNPFFYLKVIKWINCYYPFATRFKVDTQEFIESILAASPFGVYLGDILFVGLTLPSSRS